jgi:hypothetical protein
MSNVISTGLFPFYEASNKYRTFKNNNTVSIKADDHTPALDSETLFHVTYTIAELQTMFNLVASICAGQF